MIAIDQIVKGKVTGTFKVLGFRTVDGVQHAQRKPVNPDDHSQQGAGELALPLDAIIPLSTLIEVFKDLRNGEWDDMPVAKLFNVPVVREYHSVVNSFGKPVRRWPGPQKNVFVWVELANGKAVGWNENPSKGWTFPVINLKAS